MISRADIDRLKAGGHIGDDDVLMLRRAIYGDDHRIGADEAEALAELNEACAGSPAWSDLFVEATADFIVHQSEPAGYVAHNNAVWLMDHFADADRIKSATALEAMVKVLETATEAPAELELFVMRQVKHAVLSGDGPTRSGEPLSPGRIGKAEVALLRRVLYACGGSQGVAVSRAEAEMLFDINDAVTDIDNDPDWPDLFVKAVANYLMAARGYQPLSREEALRRAAWLDDREIGFGDFIGKIMAGGLRGVAAAYRDEAEGRAERLAADVAVSETITGEEADWLVGRIGRDGTFDGCERALLTFIKAEAPDIHPALKPLLAEVA